MGVLPNFPLLITSVLLGVGAGIGINLKNSCKDFGSDAARVNGIQTYNIIVLIFAILMFILSFWPVFQTLIFPQSAVL